jgi:hypothetical protein
MRWLVCLLLIGCEFDKTKLSWDCPDGTHSAWLGYTPACLAPCEVHDECETGCCGSGSDGNGYCAPEATCE